MKNVWKILGIIVLTLAIVSCGVKKNERSLESIKAKGVIRIGVFSDKAPFGYGLCKLHTFFSIYFVTLLPVFIDLNMFL